MDKGNLSKIDDKNWKEARDYCRSICPFNGITYDLLSLQDKAEYNFVLSYDWSGIYTEDRKAFAIWTGLNDLDKNGEWTWSDGSQLNYGSPNISSSPWKDGHPKENSVC